MSMARPLAIFWDHGEGGNAEHLAEHGVTPDEAEQAIGKYFDDRESSHSTPEYWVVRGFTSRGRFLLTRDALGKKAELMALQSAMTILMRERKARGLSLGDVAERSGIDKSRLSKLENDPRSNPTLATLTRSASAIGVKVSIHVDVA